MCYSTFCFLFNKEDFLALIQSSPMVSQFYLRKMSAKMVNTVYAELRENKIKLDGKNVDIMLKVLDILSNMVQMRSNGSVYQDDTETTCLRSSNTARRARFPGSPRRGLRTARRS